MIRGMILYIQVVRESVGKVDQGGLQVLGIQTILSIPAEGNAIQANAG